jgi:hypothetical protein
VTELESHPSVTKALTGVGGVAAAAFSQAPSWKPILAITRVLVSMSLWSPVMLFLTLWIKLASPGPHCFSAEARRLLRQSPLARERPRPHAGHILRSTKECGDI